MKTSLLLLACLTLASLCEIRGVDTPRAELIGRQVPNFILPSVTGKEIALADYPEIDFLVFVFWEQNVQSATVIFHNSMS